MAIDSNNKVRSPAFAAGEIPRPTVQSGVKITETQYKDELFNLVENLKCSVQKL